MKRCRKNLFIRSTMPLDSGSLGGRSLISKPKEPANAATGSVGRRRPMPDSLSHNSRDGTACASCSSAHIPPSRSGVVRDGSIRAWMNPENAEVITSTGGVSVLPTPTGSGSCGNQRSHCTWNPGSCTSRSAGIRRRVFWPYHGDLRPEQ